jgi:hypothetical protein
MAETTQSIVRRSGRWIYLLGILGFIAYAAWIMGPYLQSIIVRDAAVTTWLNRSASPIDGTVEWQPLAVGRKVGADGVIVQIENQHLSRQELTEAEIHVDPARDPDPVHVLASNQRPTRGQDRLANASLALR